jgi:hypothetical protein
MYVTIDPGCPIIMNHRPDRRGRVFFPLAANVDLPEDGTGQRVPKEKD